MMAISTDRKMVLLVGELLAEYARGSALPLEFAERVIDAINHMMDWQPIETAPKDGTVILGIDVATNALAMCAITERTETITERGPWPLSKPKVRTELVTYADFVLPGGEGDCDYHLLRNRFGFLPTHWMLPPAPPK